MEGVSNLLCRNAEIFKSKSYKLNGNHRESLVNIHFVYPSKANISNLTRIIVRVQCAVFVRHYYDKHLIFQILRIFRPKTSDLVTLSWAEKAFHHVLGGAKRYNWRALAALGSVCR